jgi:purine-nucleoside phosphorylase
VTVSTDAVFRQTLNKELAWRQASVLGVDMEMSALLAVAQYHRIPAVGLLIVSDKHVLDPSAAWHWGGEELKKNKAVAIDMFVEFIRGRK